MHFSTGLKQIRHWYPFFITAVALGLFFSSILIARGEYNDYSVNKPSAFRDYQQVMIWDSEILEALSGFRGTLMFSTGSCFSGGFIDDLTNLENAAVVTANNWHGFGLSLYDFLPGETDTRGFHDDYMNAFRRENEGVTPSFEKAYLIARDTMQNTDGYEWYWGGVEFPQFGASGNGAELGLVIAMSKRMVMDCRSMSLKLTPVNLADGAAQPVRVGISISDMAPSSAARWMHPVMVESPLALTGVLDKPNYCDSQSTYLDYCLELKF